MLNGVTAEETLQNSTITLDEAKESTSVGLEKKDPMNRVWWRVGELREIAAVQSPATPIYGFKPGSKFDQILKIGLMMMMMTEETNDVHHFTKNVAYIILSKDSCSGNCYQLKF